MQMMENKFKEKKLHAEESCIVPYIPFVIITDILSRLPIQDILRYRCVCKSWNQGISEPLFSETQLKHRLDFLLLCNRSNDDSPLLVGKNNGTWSTRKIYEEKNIQDFFRSKGWFFTTPSETRYLFISSCNGLFLTIQHAVDYGALAVYNPIMKDCLILPHPNNGFILSGDDYAFGYDRINKKYKVIRILPGLAQRDYRTLTVGESSWRILTVGESSWRKLEFTSTILKIIEPCMNPLVFDGAFHFLLTGDGGWGGILILDIASEKFQVMKFLPSIVNLVPWKYILTQMVNSLVLVENYFDASDLPVKIWEIVKESKDTFRLCVYSTLNLNLGSLYSGANERVERFHPLGAFGDDGFILFGYTHCRPHQLCLCYPKEDEASLVELTRVPMYFDAHIFAPSLVCPTTL